MRTGGLVFIVLGLLVVGSPLRSQQHRAISQGHLLGSTIPDLQLRTAEGGTVTLSHVLKEGVAVLLFVPSENTETACQPLRKTVAHLASSLRPLDISVIPVSRGAAAGSRGGSGPLSNAHFMADPQRWTLYNLGSPDTRTSALLVDHELGIRRVFRTDNGLNWDTIIENTKLWRDGNAIFMGQCARCHRGDGKDESYPGTKSLSGIGNRHSEKKIFELTQLAGFVDLSALDNRTRRALSVFVAGL
jgi:hypothetical protein